MDTTDTYMADGCVGSRGTGGWTDRNDGNQLLRNSQEVYGACIG